MFIEIEKYIYTINSTFYYLLPHLFMSELINDKNIPDPENDLRKNRYISEFCVWFGPNISSDTFREWLKIEFINQKQNLGLNQDEITRYMQLEMYACNAVVAFQQGRMGQKEVVLMFREGFRDKQLADAFLFATECEEQGKDAIEGDEVGSLHADAIRSFRLAYECTLLSPSELIPSMGDILTSGIQAEYLDDAIIQKVLEDTEEISMVTGHFADRGVLMNLKDKLIDVEGAIHSLLRLGSFEAAYALSQASGGPKKEDIIVAIDKLAQGNLAMTDEHATMADVHARMEDKDAAFRMYQAVGAPSEKFAAVGESCIEELEQDIVYFPNTEAQDEYNEREAGEYHVYDKMEELADLARACFDKCDSLNYRAVADLLDTMIKDGIEEYPLFIEQIRGWLNAEKQKRLRFQEDRKD